MCDGLPFTRLRPAHPSKMVSDGITGIRTVHPPTDGVGPVSNRE
jgi:hypothetical protein